MVCRQSSYVNIIRNIFKKIDCTSEKVNKGYFTMKVPAGKNYGPIRQKLDKLETTGVIGHADRCLFDHLREQVKAKHRYTFKLSTAAHLR